MREELTEEEYEERRANDLNECEMCFSWQDWATGMYWKGEECMETNAILGEYTAVCDDCFVILRKEHLLKKGVALEQGSAGVKITLHDGVMCVYHEQDGTLLHKRPLYEGEWSELFKWIRRDEE